MNTRRFNDLYRKLNPQQKEAVDAIEGPVMVIAGPGTGKTQILTLRIANILKQTDTTPDSILALTFTEAAAANMRQRLVSVIGSAAYYVNIFTFHGFCNHIIQEHAERFETIIGFNNASQVDQIDIIRSLLEEGSFEYLKPFGDHFFHVQNILGGIRDLKKEGIGAQEFSDLVAKSKEALLARNDLYHTKGAHKGSMKVVYQKELRQIGKNEELATFYHGYQAALAERRLYDFEDMLLAVIAELEAHKDFLLEIQEKYHYILVDEHQDTNGAQNKILELLSNFFPNPNLFVVGDEKQAIFRFQGASLDNFLYFKDAFADVRLVKLVHNYRSTQHILDASQSLIEHNEMAPLSDPLRASAQGAGSELAYHVFDTDDGERLFLVEEIKRKIEEGVPPEEIAVLYRQNKDAFPIADVFERAGIPFVIESDQDVLGDREIAKINRIFEAIGDFGNDGKLVKALHVDFLDVDPLVVYQLLREVRERGGTLHELLAHESLPKELPLEGLDRLVAVYHDMRRWHTLSFNTDFLDFFTTVMRESDAVNHLIKHPQRVEKLDKLGTLFDQLKHLVEHHRDYSLEDYLYYLEILKSHGVMIKANTRHTKHAVRLMTAHKAKGLEFDYVFIVGLYDGHWGNRRKMGTFTLPTRIAIVETSHERNEDERRLFYMALTRARQLAHMSYARYASDGKERVPSQFIGEIHEKHLCEHDGCHFDERFEKSSHFAPTSEVGLIENVEEFLRERFLQQGLSPTALNNYLTCPWRYYFNNLVRIPLAMSHHQVYGTLVHAILEDFFNERASGEEVGEEYLQARFTYHLEKQATSKRVYDAVAERGAQTLIDYYNANHKKWNYHTVNEYRIKGVIVEPGIKLTGTLDKLEINNDRNHVTVVDYKTKKPQSRNWIEGNTKTSNGDFKRQLVFYKLLLDEMPKKTYTMTEGVIDFVEPDDKGRFRREPFEITEEEVQELKQTIQTVATEILEMAFWDKRCGEKDCEYCSLRDMMQ